MNIQVSDFIKKLESIIGSTKLDQYSEKALKAIISHLQNFDVELQNPDIKLKGYIARLVVEQDPNILSAELGGQLIKLESALYTPNK